jgi:hypothetical protein
MYLTTPIPTLTLDIISKFISEKYPSIQEIALKSYTSILMYIQLYKDDSNSVYKNIHSDNLKKYTFFYKGHITYSTILKDLVSLDLLKINPKYSNDSKSGFTKSYYTTLKIDDNFSEIDIDIEFGSYLTKEQNLSKNRNYKKIINTTYSTKVDLVGYQNWLKNNIGTPLKPKRVGNKLIERVLTQEIAYKYIIRVLKFNIGLHWFKSVKDSGRFYSSFTTLPSSTLEFTTIRGRKVIECDVKNAQPLFLIKYIDNEDYKYDVSQGIFYQRFMSELKLSKNVIKNMMYSKVFFNDRRLLSGVLYDAFEKFYPSLIKEINILKMDKLWLKLQKIESDLIINNFDKENNCLTKHDAIIFIEDRKELVVKFDTIIKDFII